ncbi:MAG: 16S rRNA (guanine(966)-N(2))-methyltransferase RsmD [Betaproteobacteria bacterium]
MARPANRLRIIGGTHRGRVVRFADAPGLRPTPDRVRETLFNWLGQELTGLTTFEAYAGSGVLSLEALSRGAATAVAVDRNAALVRALRDQASALALDGLETICGDALAVLARESRRFDVIFLDPPFTDDPWPRLFPLSAARLAADGYIYAEAGRELQPPEGVALCRHGRAGQVHYHLLRNAIP